MKAASLSTKLLHKLSRKFTMEWSLTCSMNSLTNICNTSMVFPGVVYENLSKLKSTGNNQFQTFLEDRLIEQKLPIDAKITMNLDLVM